MEDYSESGELDIQELTKVLPTFQRLSQEGRERLLRTIATFFGIDRKRVFSSGGLSGSDVPVSVSESNGRFSQDRSLSPKEFMVQKQPRTDVERIACLAYYLTHYRDTPYFKTIDLSKLNTDAAQPKFSNPANAVDNATKNGYLALATKGNKQLSAAGEQFVQALPDRDAARTAMARTRPRRKPKRVSQKRGVND